MFFLCRFVVPVLDRLGGCFSVAQGGSILASGLHEMAVSEVPLREKKVPTPAQNEVPLREKKVQVCIPDLPAKPLLAPDIIIQAPYVF